MSSEKFRLFFEKKKKGNNMKYNLIRKEDLKKIRDNIKELHMELT